MSDGPTESARLERIELSQAELEHDRRVDEARMLERPPCASELLGQQVPGAVRGRLFGHSTLTPALKDSGQREQMATGSQRDSRVGKGRFDLLFRAWRALRKLAGLFEAGCAKYGERNWEKGQPLSRYMDSGLRHIAAVFEGRTDEDHLTQATWNLLAALETRERVREGELPAELEDVGQ